MINIMIPACGSNQHFKDGFWPKNVSEINGKPMIQYTVENFNSIPDKRFVYLLKKEECSKFHTDNMVKIFTDNTAVTIQLEGNTGGALCTGLMAIPYINNDDELIVSNHDQLFDCSMEEIREYFKNNGADCGVVTFECVHPRWSYIRLEGDNVVETAEKRPISKHAIAGLYYFRYGKDYVEAAKRTIKKGKSYNGRYFLSAAVNEMILLNKNVLHYEVDAKDYHTFYEPSYIETYERILRER